MEAAIKAAIPVANQSLLTKKKQAHQKPCFNRLPLYGRQRAIIEDPARFTITEGSTKAGKTFSHIEWLLSEAIALGHGNHWWVAPSMAQARMVFRRSMDRLRGYVVSGKDRKKVADPIEFTANHTEQFISVGGAMIWFKTAENPDLLYGEDVQNLAGDEISRWREDAWIACYSTLTATQGKAKLIGNVKGRKNFAYQLARRAESGEPNWAYYKLTAAHAIEGGVISQETVNEAQRQLKDETFRELYFAEAADDGSNPFGLDAIDDCVVENLSSLPVVCWGIDLGQKVDWTVLIGLDRNGDVAAFERWQKPWRECKRDIIRIIGNQPTAMDSTGLGDPILADVQAECSQVEGVVFTSSPKSKQRFFELLEVDFQQRAFKLPESVIAIECRSFEYEYTRTGTIYSAPAGEHDDCVCALALARNKYREIQPLLRVYQQETITQTDNTYSFN